MGKEYAEVLWQTPPDDNGIAEPAIGIQIYDDIVTLKQDGMEINLNFESIDDLFRIFRRIYAERKANSKNK